ncbi:DUF6361 family protein [Micrococcus sp. IITD107]|uniref:DUF6361 family protein n=1 Tax=Micrococcus sp. IITD107 TaxID=3342790 RepID=UPI0035B78591
MTSSFGWLALDPEQRRRMMEAVDQFRDETTIDDLGFGAIRDSFADALFPGTSTIQTRLRYALFIPWLLQEASHRQTVAGMQAMFRKYEYQLIDALKRGGESQGVIGVTAGRSLRRMASEVYWGSMLRWGITEPGFTPRAYFERELLRREELSAAPRSEDPESRLELTPTGIDPRLPAPPEGLLQSSDFTLRPADAEYLRESITRTCPGTLLSHLVTHRPETWTAAHNAPSSPYDPAIRAGLPPDLLAVVDRSERFALTAQGANLLYNLLLSRATGKHDQRRGSLTGHYQDRISAWFEEISEREPLNAHDLHAIWQMVIARGGRVARTTQDFITTWVRAVTEAQSAPDLTGSRALREMIIRREREKKGSRARLTPGNQRALDAWGGASGTSRFDYRWTNVKRHLQDLYDAEEVA